MKRIGITSLLLLIFLGMHAQNSVNKERGFEIPPLQFFAGTNMHYANIINKDALFMDLNLAVSWNASNAMGLDFGSTVNKFTPEIEPDKLVFFRLVLTGLFYEYTLNPTKKLHLTFPLGAGVGEAHMGSKDFSHGSAYPYGEEYYFYFKTALGLEYNLAKNWRLTTGISNFYLVGNTEYRNITSSEMSSFTANIGIKFGKFYN